MTSKTESSSQHIEDSPTACVEKMTVSNENSGYDEEFVQRVKWKVDKRLCFVIAVMYTICQIDRQNLPNAYVKPSLTLIW